MKFLCIECDEAMKITETHGPHDGSMTVVFGCPACGKGVAMLTNPMETQMVRALDVKIGRKPLNAEPMSVIKNALVTKTENSAPPLSETPATDAPDETRPASKCPFTSTVTEAIEKNKHIHWTPEAEARLERIPAYVRPMVKKSIEQQAEARGLPEIDAVVLDQIKGELGM